MAELWVVATPIGNLQDMSARMADALTRADLIAAEDTRVTMKLLNHLGVSKPLISCHRHNERRAAPEIVRRMIEEDLIVALTCDAGTPGISDPGVALVREACEAGIKITPICGPSACVAALSASGFDAREFSFYGFLPREKRALKEKLLSLRSGADVAVVYESPHRVVDLMAMVASELPGARACVCCDISKKFELILTGSAEDVLLKMRANPNVEKGEYVVVLDMSNVEKPVDEVPREGVDAALLRHMLQGLDSNAASAMAIEEGYARNEVYRAKLSIKRLIEREGG